MALAEGSVEIQSPDASGTILLAEDDPSVRGLACQALERKGYTIVEASNGEEALRAFCGSPDDFDLLLTDVVMPLMGGRELAERVAEARPELPVVFMSGYLEDRQARRYIVRENAVFLQKPWSIGDLLATVGRVLAGGAQPPQ